MAVTLIVAGLVLACGPDFPQMLLQHREQNLLALHPSDWLLMQIQDLVPQAGDSLRANEAEGLVTEEIEQRDVDAGNRPGLAAMRAEKNGAAAYAAGDGLPEAVRLYAAGAVEFRLAAAPTETEPDAAAILAALSYFERVLQLPEKQRAPRGTWASYMAGRTLQLSADPTAPERAITYFQQTRELARKGLPDPLGLAVASYGEEGAIALQRGDVAHAMDLYLEQAARGSSMARASLGAVAKRLAADPDLTLRHIQDPRIQKLWLAGMIADGFDGYYFNRPNDSNPHNQWVERIDKVAAGVDRSKFAQLDRLAVIAYATGRFELAGSLAAGLTTPLASVVRAKLALRAGDHQTAASEFTTALGHRNDRNSGLPDSTWSKLLAENGVLAMSRGDYASALQSLLEAGGEHWLDAAYVAERVLSLDELTDFAKRHVPASTAPDRRISTDPWWHNYFGRPPDTSRALRLLLARRQMREQRFDAALANFRGNDLALDKEHPSLAAIASEYAAAIRGSTGNWTRIGRAAALFRAAQLAKQFGMELLGYELAPDFATLDGAETLPVEASSDSYTSANETTRIKANPVPAVRFHYRVVAYDLAQRSADNLPPRSQAFAAVLCSNLRWSQRSDDMGQAKPLYQRYVREAAYVAWSPRFGERCEAPDFHRATTRLWHQRIHAARVALRPYKIPLAVAVVALVAGCAALLVRRRRRALN